MRRLPIFALFFFTMITSADEYQCSAEEYYWQEAHKLVEGGVKTVNSCEQYWPTKHSSNYRFIQIGFKGISIKNAIQLNREEVVSFSKLHSKEKIIIIDENSIMISNNYWCLLSNNTHVLTYGIAGVPSELVTGNWIMNASTALQAVQLGGYQLVALQNIHGSLDDFIRVSTKTIIFDDNISLITQLAEKHKNYLSRRVFFAHMSSERYQQEQTKALLSTKAHHQTPKRYLCNR